MSYYNNQNRPYANQPSVNTKIRTVFTDDAMLTISYWNERISCKISAATLDAQGGKHYRTDGLTFALDAPRATAVSVCLGRLIQNEIESVEFDTGIDQLTHVTFSKEPESSSFKLTICKFNDTNKTDSVSLSIVFPHEEFEVSGTETIIAETELQVLIRIFSGQFISPATIIHANAMDRNRSHYQSKTYNSNGQYYNNPNAYSQQANITEVKNVDDLFGDNFDDNAPF